MALANAMPLPWNGSDDDLPEGWREQVLRSVEARDRGLPVDTLGAMQIAMRGDARGAGLSGTMVGAMRAGAKAAGYRAVIANVRPTWKERYPLIPIENYARWTRDDGLPFDPWMRLHARLGDVCVLPAAGRTAWLRSHAGHAQRFRGHHGGLHPDEMETWVGARYS